MDAVLETKLIECLSALERGEALEQILARYPQDATALRPALETALALPQVQLEPSLAARSASRDAFLARAQMMRNAPSARRPRFSFIPQMLRLFASLALVLIIGATALVSLSSPALPGDALYGVKRAVEGIRLSLAADRVSLSAQFEQTRRDEALALIETDRAAEIEFSGVIEAMQDEQWRVSGLTLQLGSSTRIDGEPQVGRRVHVRALTMRGGIYANTILIEDDDQPAPSATPSPTPVNTHTSTFTATATPAPSTTPVASATPSPSATPAPSVTPTQSAPTPTDVPDNDNGDNDNSNDNGNGNDNDNSNVNDNVNENGNENGNGNENDNSNGNDNDDHSGPGNGNENDNANSNDNDN